MSEDDYISVMERYVLEILSESSEWDHHDFSKLENLTGIKSEILKIIINSLMNKQVIDLNKGPNKDHQFISKKINQDENIKQETKEIFSYILENYFEKIYKKNLNQDNHIKLRKIYPTNEENMILDNLMYNLEKYILQIEERSQERNKTNFKNRKIVFFGKFNYFEVIDTILNQTNE